MKLKETCTHYYKIECLCGKLIYHTRHGNNLIKCTDCGRQAEIKDGFITPILGEYEEDTVFGSVKQEDV